MLGRGEKKSRNDEEKKRILDQKMKRKLKKKVKGECKKRSREKKGMDRDYFYITKKVNLN